MEILIVEDDLISRRLLKKVLTEMGHQVIETHDGGRAWEVLQEKPVQIVISDWMVSAMEEPALCRKIRASGNQPYVYIIMLAAGDGKTDLAEIFRAGADDYLPKPFDPEVLKARIMTGLRVIDLEEHHSRLANTLAESRDKMRVVLDAFKEEIVSLDRRKTEEIRSLNDRLLETSAQIENKDKKLESTLKQLENTQTQMLRSEKMASIGQLAAGVAHEINNPTGFVSSNLKTLSDYQADIGRLIQKYQALISSLTAAGHKAGLNAAMMVQIRQVTDFENQIDINYLLEDIVDLIGDCREGTERIKKIVIDLKDFAHPGEDRIQAVDINNGLASTLNVVNNELKYKATVYRDFGKISLVRGYPQQLNQVFMNILVNAAQSIPSKGEIHVKTRQKGEDVHVQIRDTGYGIAEENLSRIFDPFFTTKDVGKGTGLGMNIAYNIIKKHNGSIDVRSKINRGTTFTVRLPAARAQPEAASRIHPES